MTDGTYHLEPTSWAWAGPTLRRNPGAARERARRSA
jgi:hypothetical protein